MGQAFLAVGLLAATLVATPPSGPSERLYGRVETIRGEVHVGFIRWGRGGAGWADLLSGYKEVSEENQRQVRLLKAQAEPQGDRAARSIVYNGVLITWDEDDSELVPDTAQSGLRFGHVRSVTRSDESAARVELRSGVVIELASVNRRAPFVDSLFVESEGGGEVTVAWGEVTQVRFEPAPETSSSPSSRLHGTARMRGGDSYTGYLSFGAFGAGRVFTSDDFVGNDRGRQRRIPFAAIDSITWEGASARVSTSAGEVVRLEEAPSGNRTLRISDPDLGGVVLSLGRVEAIHFHAAASPVTYESFEPARRLRGTVTTNGGERYQGFLRWDNDEESSWEILNGSGGGLTFTVELSKVRSIASDERRRSRVTLWDGRELELSGSNDVGPGNKGVVIEQDDGTFHFVDWLQIDGVELEGP